MSHRFSLEELQGVGRLTRSGLRLRLLCSKSNLRWDWLLHAASRMGPG